MLRVEITGLGIIILDIWLYFKSESEGGNFIIYWSLHINQHFEGTVRIQENRDHKVVTDVSECLRLRLDTISKHSSTALVISLN